MSATANSGAVSALTLPAPPPLQSRCAQRQPPAWCHSRPQLLRRVAVRSAGDHEPQQYEDVAQDSEAADGSAQHSHIGEDISGGDNQRPSRRSIVTQGAVAAAAAIGGQYLWLRSGDLHCEQHVQVLVVPWIQLGGSCLISMMLSNIAWVW
jgi:hypothetical protein